MKKKFRVFILVILSIFTTNIEAQVTEIAPGNFKSVDVGRNLKGAHSKSVILFHEIYNGTKISKNYAIGEIHAFRGTTGANNRTNITKVNTSSAYNQTYGSITSMNSDGRWELKTVSYNGKKYIAAHVPFRSDEHNHNFRFIGRLYSTGEQMKLIVYEDEGEIINSEIYSSMQDYTTNMVEYHDVSKFIVNGTVGIGTDSMGNHRLAVEGSIGAREIKVEASGWSDFVFENDYNLPSLQEVEAHIKEKGHLKDIPSAAEVKKGGFFLGEMDAKLLQKIEELTLYTIQQEKQLKRQSEEIEELKILVKKLIKFKE